jgi:hypothetical protein
MAPSSPRSNRRWIHSLVALPSHPRGTSTSGPSLTMIRKGLWVCSQVGRLEGRPYRQPNSFLCPRGRHQAGAVQRSGLIQPGVNDSGSLSGSCGKPPRHQPVDVVESSIPPFKGKARRKILSTDWRCLLPAHKRPKVGWARRPFRFLPLGRIHLQFRIDRWRPAATVGLRIN